ncbi:MAG: hypothetical protein IVW53_03585 [Chloroflexi bacterium]|nr:hypothetical protein [Chloroflexota bacterium]
MADDDRPRSASLRFAPSTDAAITVAVGLAIVAIALVVYVASDLERPNFYNHFVWQAAAWLDGKTSIAFPVVGGGGAPGNDYFNDVEAILSSNGMPTGRGLLPFPPLPAVVLLPFVAVYGLATNEQLLAAVLGAFDVGLAFWMLGRLPVGRGVRVAVTMFFGFGTVFWFAAEKGTTWYFAHVVAVGLCLAAVGLALGGELTRPGRGRRFSLDGRQFVAGMLFGLACTARLTIVFGAPFFLLVGSGGTWLRRGASAGLGAALPLAALAAYNLAASGHVFNPVYDFLYRQEAVGYAFLGYHPDWAIEDLRYVPQNLALALVGPPDIAPTTLDFGARLCTAAGAVRGWFDPACPIVAPNSVGMGLLLTSPAYLLATPAILTRRPGRIVVAAIVAIVAIGFIDLMHFSQGWVQFGYRFSLDWAPFALVLVALGLARLSRSAPGRAIVIGGGLIAVSIAVNLWGVWWAAAYGW